MIASVDRHGRVALRSEILGMPFFHLFNFFDQNAATAFAFKHKKTIDVTDLSWPKTNRLRYKEKQEKKRKREIICIGTAIKVRLVGLKPVMRWKLSNWSTQGMPAKDRSEKRRGNCTDDLICTTPRLCQNNMTPVTLRGRGTTSAYNCFPATGLYFKSKVLASVGRGSTETTRLQHGSSMFGNTHAKGESCLSECISLFFWSVWLFCPYSKNNTPTQLSQYMHYFCLMMCFFV